MLPGGMLRRILKLALSSVPRRWCQKAGRSEGKCFQQSGAHTELPEREQAALVQGTARAVGAGEGEPGRDTWGTRSEQMNGRWC